MGSVQVYGPDGLGKTAMGGHPRRRLSQASVLEPGPPPSLNGTTANAKAGALPGTTTAVGGGTLDTPVSTGGGVLSVAAAVNEDFDEDGGMEDNEDEEARRTQLQEAGALKAQQQAAFRLNPGLQEVRTLDTWDHTVMLLLASGAQCRHCMGGFGRGLGRLRRAVVAP